MLIFQIGNEMPDLLQSDAGCWLSFETCHLSNVAVIRRRRTMQIIQLDKHIRLLDSPGVVVATKMADSAAMVLRNCVRVSLLIVVWLSIDNSPLMCYNESNHYADNPISYLLTTYCYIST